MKFRFMTLWVGVSICVLVSAVTAWRVASRIQDRLNTAMGIYNAAVIPSVPQIPADVAPQENLSLSTADRQVIWDAEHHALELSLRANPRLIAALKQADEPALLRCFSPEFSGHIPSMSEAKVHQHGPAEFRLVGTETGVEPNMRREQLKRYMTSLWSSLEGTSFRET